MKQTTKEHGRNWLPVFLSAIEGLERVPLTGAVGLEEVATVAAS